MFAINYFEDSYIEDFESERHFVSHTWTEHINEPDLQRQLLNTAKAIAAKLIVFDKNNRVIQSVNEVDAFRKIDSAKAYDLIEKARKDGLATDYSFLGAMRSGHVYFAFQLDDTYTCLLLYEVSKQRDEFVGFIFNLLAIFIIAVIIFLIFSYLFARYILKYFFAANQTAQNIVAGDYSQRINLKSDDEIGDFLDNFNKLTVAVEEKIKKINNQKEILSDYAQRQSEFTSNAAHEMKTPLSIILLNGEVLYSRIEEETDKLLAQKIIVATNRLAQTIKALLILAKLESNNICSQLEIHKIDICSLLGNSLDSMLQNYAHKLLKVDFRHPEQRVVIETNYDLLTHAVNNLIDNAGKYAEDKGHVELDVEIHSNVLTIKVSNSGKGIEQEDIPYIFDRFYRADKSRSSKIAGSGLGLAITKRVSEVLQGEIIVQSKKDGCTTFSLKLPLNITSAVTGAIGSDDDFR